MKYIILLVLFCIFYWIAIVQTSIYFYDECTNFNWKGVAYYNAHLAKEGDSCGLRAQLYKAKAIKTLRLLPKFARP